MQQARMATAGESETERMFKAIIFDFDGLIIDTEVPIYEAWRSVCRAYDVDLPLSTWAPYIGGGHDSFDVYDHLAEVTGRQVDRDRVRHTYQEALEALFAQSSPLPGVADYISSARDLGLRIGIASSSPRAWVQPKLEHVGMADMFDTVVCFDDVGSAKPNPASYLAALGNLGVTAQQAFALEDSPTGVQGAKNAGLLCVAVPGIMTGGLSFDHADMRIESLVSMSLEELLRALSRLRAATQQQP